MWDVNSGELIQELDGHQGWVNNASFSPDGARIVTASNDNTARVWDVNSGELIQELDGHQDAVRNASFSPNGARIVTASDDNTARVWDSDNLTTLIARGCDYLNAYFITHPTVLNTLELCHTPARKLAAAPALVEEGDRVAADGQLNLAVEYYQTALTWAQNLDINPFSRAQKQSAPFWVQQGANLTQAGDILGAIENFQKALQLDPTLSTDSQPWNSLCWFGSLAGYAQNVLFACEKAVELAAENGGYRDSRGLARALTGDIDGAIQDFQAFLDWGQGWNNEWRQEWIRALKAGQNPFTPDTLEALRNE